MNKVTISGEKELAVFISQLVREGVTFEAYPKLNDIHVESLYIVEFTGGF